MRTKLIAELLALLAVICVIIGVVTEFALYAFLLDQRDAELAQASRRAATFTGEPPADMPPMPPPAHGHGDGERNPLNAPGQAAGTLTARIVDGNLMLPRRISSSGNEERLPPPERDALLRLPADGEPRTVDLGPFGDYRVSAQRAADGAVVITGLPLFGVDETLLSVGFILGGVALAGLALTGVTGMVIVRRTLQPLDAVAGTARRVSELRLDRGEVALSERVPSAYTDPATEVGQVGAALNRMLGHVSDALAARQASETRVRQFVADASHELRTPLAAIRGYAELTRRGHQQVPEEIRYAMGRVESESARMTTLVEDLLLLARLDSAQPLNRDEVDLSRVVADAVSDAAIAGHEHQWRLNLPPEPVTLTGDEARLRQVLVNLLANARTHTPAGTEVDTSLSTVDESVLLTVTDNGPGIPAGQLPEVFERFARGDSSRSRAAGSTGLGLAIVAAVVGAHRGEVSVQSVPGHTTFTVRLPVHS